MAQWPNMAYKVRQSQRQLLRTTDSAAKMGQGFNSQGDPIFEGPFQFDIGLWDLLLF